MITSPNDRSLQNSSFTSDLRTPVSISSSNPRKEAVVETFFMAMDNIDYHMSRLREEADI